MLTPPIILSSYYVYTNIPQVLTYYNRLEDETMYIINANIHCKQWILYSRLSIVGGASLLDYIGAVLRYLTDCYSKCSKYNKKNLERQ